MHINAHEIEPEDSCTSEHFSYKSEPRLHVVVEEPNWFIPADFFKLSKLHGLADPLCGTSWDTWNWDKLHLGYRACPGTRKSLSRDKERPPAWVYDLSHGTRRGLF